MNREILKAKIAEVISSTNKSGNEKLEAILAVVDAYSSADNGAKPIVSGSLPPKKKVYDWPDPNMANGSGNFTHAAKLIALSIKTLGQIIQDGSGGNDR